MVARTQTGGRRAGTQWRRFGLVAAPAVLISGAMLAATAQGAVAASFAVAGTSFKLHADKLVGTSMSQFGTVDTEANGTHHAVAVNAFKTAKLYSLCQSMVIPTPFKDMTIRLTAGSDSDPVTATNLVTDLDLLQGDVTFNNPSIGIDAAKTTEGAAKGQAGAFALQASSVDIDNADINAWATTAGTFVLHGLKLTAAFGKNECF